MYLISATIVRGAFKASPVRKNFPKPSGHQAGRLFNWWDSEAASCRWRDAVKYPNIAYAADIRGLAQYQLASSAGMSETRLSRCVNGRTEFSPEERNRVAQVLGFDEPWLFERPKPP